jgi:hypothetical protein
MSASRVARAVAVFLHVFAFVSAPPKLIRVEAGPQVSEKVAEPVDDQIEIQKTKVEAAKSALVSAQLAREIAEITVNEYDQGLFAQEKATLEAEIKLAGDDLKAVRERIPEMDDRLAKIKKVSKGSTSDLVQEFRFTDQVEITRLEEFKTRVAVRQAESKLKVLLEYAKPKRIKELRSDVEKARSHELAVRAQWQLEQARLKRLLAQGPQPTNKPTNGVDTLEKLLGQEVHLRVAEKGAEATYENAKLAREVAEIGVTEYELGVFVQERATAEGEVRLAKNDLEQAHKVIEIATDRLAKIKAASTGSISDLATEFAFAELVANAHRRPPRAELAVKQLEAKLKMLGDFTKPKHIKELRLAVENARAEELAKKAEWQVVQSNLKRLRESIKQLEQPKR